MGVAVEPLSVAAAYIIFLDGASFPGQQAAHHQRNKRRAIQDDERRIIEQRVAWRLAKDATEAETNKNRKDMIEN